MKHWTGVTPSSPPSGSVVVVCWPHHYLDASEGKPDKGEVFVIKDSTGKPSAMWAHWRVVSLDSGAFAFESVRWPHHYLDASEGIPGKGKVFVTKDGIGTPSAVWAHWKIQIHFGTSGP